jgi:rubrerythrin
MFTEELRSVVASWVRAGNSIIAMQHITAKSPLNLRDAKAIALHITQDSGTCHHCSYPLTGEATDHCPFCQAVNYDW